MPGNRGWAVEGGPPPTPKRHLCLQIPLAFHELQDNNPPISWQRVLHPEALLLLPLFSGCHLMCPTGLPSFRRAEAAPLQPEQGGCAGFSGWPVPEQPGSTAIKSGFGAPHPVQGVRWQSQQPDSDLRRKGWSGALGKEEEAAEQVLCRFPRSQGLHLLWLRSHRCPASSHVHRTRAGEVQFSRGSLLLSSPDLRRVS